MDFETVANRDEYDRENLLENMMLGSPEQVIEKLERYKAAGVDQFIYGASFFVPHQNARRSLELFCDKVIPHFRKQENAASPEMAGAKEPADGPEPRGPGLFLTRRQGCARPTT